MNVYENGGNYVQRVGPGEYHVYRFTGTCSERHGIYAFPEDPEKAFLMATEHCDELATHEYVGGFQWRKKTDRNREVR